MYRFHEFMEQARQFEQLAYDEPNPEIKARFEEQAKYFRQAAERRKKFVEAATDTVRSDKPA
jgi:hypothetical protein